MKPCQHLEASDEAYGVNHDGTREPITVQLCCHAENEPERYTNMPLWLMKLAVGGIAVQPMQHCVGCPAYKPKD